jgi:hypothetical protein
MYVNDWEYKTAMSTGTFGKYCIDLILVNYYLNLENLTDDFISFQTHLIIHCVYPKVQWLWQVICNTLIPW